LYTGIKNNNSAGIGFNARNYQVRDMEQIYVVNSGRVGSKPRRNSSKSAPKLRSERLLGDASYFTAKNFDMKIYVFLFVI